MIDDALVSKGNLLGQAFESHLPYCLKVSKNGLQAKKGFLKLEECGLLPPSRLSMCHKLFAYLHVGRWASKLFLWATLQDCG